MELKFFCPLWGSEHLPFAHFLQKVKDAGYDGVEMSFPPEEKERDHSASLIRQSGLLLIAQHWETVAPDFDTHLKQYTRRLKNLAATDPLFINSQTGKDYYPFAWNKKLFDAADAVSQETGVPIIHETHRGKWSYAAHVTRYYLTRIPSLALTFDASHWCNTAESLLHDQQDAVNMAIKATKHIHARVGYPEGPQVPDPRAAEWKPALDAHTAWWDAIVEMKKNDAQITITPEFGAPPYMVLHPQTKSPLTDQWEVNVWMMNYLKDRYKNTR